MMILDEASWHFSVDELDVVNFQQWILIATRRREGTLRSSLRMRNVGDMGTPATVRTDQSAQDKRRVDGK